MNPRVLDAIAQWARAGQEVAVATVAATRRSAPRPVGTKMAVSSTGAVVGAVSGGCVEGAVVAVAEAILAGGGPQLVHYGIDDEQAWDVGLPCGGEISVWIEAHAPDSLQARFLQLARADQRAVLVTAVPVPGASATGPAGRPTEQRLLICDDGSSQGTLGSAELDRTATDVGSRALWSETSELRSVSDGREQLFIEASVPRPRLIIVGAVDYAAPLATAARLAGWRAFVVDPRATFAVPERFPDAERVISAWPADAFAALGGIDAATAIAVLSHDPKLDDAALALALGSDALYIGAMGSRRAQARRRARLAAAGFGVADLDRIAAPLGLDLGARSSGETALSIMSEIIALRHGRGGGRLIDVSGAIHAGAR